MRTPPPVNAPAGPPDDQDRDEPSFRAGMRRLVRRLAALYCAMCSLRDRQGRPRTHPMAGEVAHWVRYLARKYGDTAPADAAPGPPGRAEAAGAARATFPGAADGGPGRAAAGDRRAPPPATGS